MTAPNETTLARKIREYAEAKRALWDQYPDATQTHPDDDDNERHSLHADYWDLRDKEAS